MEGGTLRHLLDREAGLDFGRLVEIAQSIAGALDYAHRQGLIHLDVKPENILFTNGQACLSDFGIARALILSGSGNPSSSITIRGTPAYMSPEQAAGEIDLDGRSDIYSLACVMYEMITGMPPFIGPTAQSVISQRFVFTPREVAVYRPMAPPGIDAVLAKAFAITPADRYRTAGELVAAVRAVLSEAPVAMPNGRLEYLRRLFARWRGWTIGIDAAITAAILFVAVPILRWPTATRRIPSVAMDTTRVVLIPFEREQPRVSSWRDEDLLEQALARWRGVSLVDHFQTADALRRRGSIRTSEDALDLAASLNAGRYIRGRVTSSAQGSTITASLFDVSSARPLYAATQEVPNDIAGAIAAYAKLVDSLLLRGAIADSVAVQTSGRSSLPAVQAFSAAQLALDDWDLERADSLFQTAVTYDADFAKANLWLAQVRAWQDRPSSFWATVAERAVALQSQLNNRERQLAAAMVMLGHRKYDEACSVYDALSRRNDRDFAALFGSGQCRTMIKERIVHEEWIVRQSAFSDTVQPRQRRVGHP